MRHRVGMLGRLLPNLSSWLRWLVGLLAYRSKLLYKTQEHNCLVYNALSGISTFHLDKSSMIFTEAFIVEKFREFNKSIFYNTLPEPTFQLSRARSFLGKCVTRRLRGLEALKKRAILNALCVSARVSTCQKTNSKMSSSMK